MTKPDSNTAVFSDETQKDRKHLLISSVIGIAIGTSGIIPTRVSALGIEFSYQDRVALLWVLWGIVFYLLVAFCLHAGSDYFAWRETNLRRLEEIEARMRTGEGDMTAHISQRDRIKAGRRVSLWHVLQISFEFILPLLLAASSMVALYSAQTPLN
jgi:hypothetical protein